MGATETPPIPLADHADASVGLPLSPIHQACRWFVGSPNCIRSRNCSVLLVELPALVRFSMVTHPPGCGTVVGGIFGESVDVKCTSGLEIKQGIERSGKHPWATCVPSMMESIRIHGPVLVSLSKNPALYRSSGCQAGGE